jgi:hypothetical protein
MKPLAGGSQPAGWVVLVLVRFLPPWHYLHIGGNVLPCVRQHGVTGPLPPLLVRNLRRILQAVPR